VSASEVNIPAARAADLGAPRGGVLGSQTEERLECCHRGLAAIVSKHELVEINLELGAAHAVVGSGQPLLPVADRTVGQRDQRLGAFSQLRAVRLAAREVSIARLFERWVGV